MNSSSTFRENIKQLYDFSGWAIGETTRGYPLSRFLPATDEMPGFTFEQRYAIPNTRSAFIDYYQQTDPQVRIATTICTYNSPQAAGEATIDLLSTCMTELPTCRERGFQIGDVCFCGYGDIVESVLFIRSNVLVQVENVGLKNVSVIDLATTLDRQLAAVV